MIILCYCPSIANICRIQIWANILPPMPKRHNNKMGPRKGSTPRPKRHLEF